MTVTDLLPAGPRQPSGKRFPLAWPRWQPPPRPGIAVLVRPDAAIAWADGLLARDNGGLVVWAGTATDPEQQALGLLVEPGVQAATLAPERTDPRRVGLSLSVAVDLAGGRAGGPAAGPCLTSCAVPAVPPGAVRIPHLVTVGHTAGDSDTVVWELVERGVAQHWLGRQLPEQSFFESRLDELLRLRAAARRGQLPGTAVSAGLAELLPDRDLSIRHVYEHPVVFRGLLSP